MKRTFIEAFCVSTVLLTASALWGLDPTADELSQRQRWAAAKFDLRATAPEEFPDRVVAVESFTPVEKNGRFARPLKLGDKLYDAGFYCHANARLDVVLSQNAVKFKAIVGIDSNETTKTAEGSIRLVVRSDEEVFFRSEIVRESASGVPIEVALPNVKAFTLEIDDAGDGISCDQADLANAAVELEDGSELLLSSLPLFQQKDDRTFETAYPFEFVYGGRSSREFLGDWKKSVEEKVEGDKRLRTLTFEEPNGALKVVCDCVEYLDFPTVEWKLTFKNAGTVETPILEEILPISTAFSRDFFAPLSAELNDPAVERIAQFNRRAEFLLRHFKGGGYGLNDYMPLETPLPPNASREYVSFGRPCSVELPYFNLQAGLKGWIVVVGWPGQWKASFVRDGALSTQVAAKQATTRMKLLPGEEIRTPTIVAQNWARKSWLDAQNVWRAWMLKYNTPRPDGDFIRPFAAGCNWFDETANADEASQLLYLDRYAEEKIDLDYWWIDAGWYPREKDWCETGTWKVDKSRYPGGIRAISDKAKSRGVGTILWFEPERVYPGTELATEHPEWLLPGKEPRPGTQVGDLLDIGNDEAREWLIERVVGLIRSEGVDIYRQDFNIDPLEHWRNNDAPDRQGFTENRYVQGHLAYWDALVERVPGLRIDTCASGGNRNDLESLRRAVPLTRNDYFLNPTANQNHTFGIALWYPLHGTGWRAPDVYGARSAMVPYLDVLYDMRDKSLDYDAIRSYFQTWRDVFVPLFTADYYPLAPFLEREDAQSAIDMQQNIWIGWQYNDPKTGTGAIQMFRREFSPYRVGTFALHGLERDAVYTVTDLDSGKAEDRTGAELMEGLDIRIDDAPGAVVLTYQKKRAARD